MTVFPSRELIGLYQLLSGRRMLERFDELSRSQWLAQDELIALQRQKLQRLVEYAYLHVPYYHRVFDQVGFSPLDLLHDPASFQKIPFTTKEIMREYGQEFFSDEPELRKSLRSHYTSGSTGVPFTFWDDLNKRDFATADVFRTYTMSGWKLGEPLAYLWGGSWEQKNWRQELSSRITDFVFNQFREQAYDLSPEKLNQFARKIRSNRPSLLCGYTTALYVFAQFVKENKLKDIHFQAVYASAEVLFPHQRKLIEEAFGCPVYNRYGTTEMGIVACECDQHNGMHICVENCLVEVFNDNQIAADGTPGELVVTNLNNFGFPFIRYRLKDVAQLKSSICSCGRKSPLIDCIYGRTVDIFKTTDGRILWGDLEPSVFPAEGILQCQVIQKELDLILVRIVKDGSFGEAQKKKIESTFKNIMGASTRVIFEFPDSIPQPKSGKFRYAYSELYETPQVKSID